MSASIIQSHLRVNAPRAAAVFSCIALITGCGSGGGDDEPVAEPQLVVSGSASNGAAMASAAVQARCASGDGSATTGADGSYAVRITRGRLPCTLRASSGGTQLHSVATGSGDAATAQITPATELVVASLAGSSATPAAYHDAFAATAAQALTPAAAAAALQAVASFLGDAGIPTTAVANLLTTQVEGAYTQALATLNGNLAASQTTLAEAAAAVGRAATVAGGGSATATGVASLPVAQLLAPSAPNCRSLRSGRYRLVINNLSSSADDNTEVLTIDAPALTITNAQGDVFHITQNDDCRFSTGDGSELVVSLGGVIVARLSVDDTSMRRGAVAFPEQTHTLAELAGEWNALGLERDIGVTNGRLVSSTGSFDGSGRVTALSYCDPLLTCRTFDAASLPALQLAAHSGGGFVMSNANVLQDRYFAYRGGNGELMMVSVAGGGHIGLHTRKLALGVPPVGRVRTSWDMTINANYTSPSAIAVSKNTITSADAATGRFGRDAVIYPAGTATRPETLANNEPRAGFGHRFGGSVTASDGSSVTLSEFYSLQLTGMGVAAVAFPASNALLLSATVAEVLP